MLMFPMQFLMNEICVTKALPGVSEGEFKMGVIPANTQLQTALSVRRATESQRAHIELNISTPNGTVKTISTLFFTLFSPVLQLIYYVFFF